MRYDYWTIRAIPRPMGITSIGVGVVVVDPRTGESGFEFREDTKAFGADEYADAARHAVQQLKSELAGLGTSGTPLGLDGTTTVTSYLNLAVVDHERVLELNQAFNFQADNVESTLIQVDAWTLKLDKLRQRGGLLELDDGLLELDSEVHVTTVIQPPQTTTQKNTFRKFQGFCDGLGVQILQESDVEAHAENLALKLVS